MKMTKSEIITIYEPSNSTEKHSRYLVRLKDETKCNYYTSYYVSISQQTTEVFDARNHHFKNEKIIKVIIDELMKYLSNSIIPIKSCIDVVEDKLKRIEEDLKWLSDNKQSM